MSGKLMPGEKLPQGKKGVIMEEDTPPRTTPRINNSNTSPLHSPSFSNNDGDNNGKEENSDDAGEKELRSYDEENKSKSE